MSSNQFSLLEQVATINDRKAGTPAGQRARDHIIDHLKIKVPNATIKLESFDVDVLTDFTAELKIAFHDGTERNLKVHFYDNTGKNAGTITGELFDAGLYLSKKKRPQVNGKIVIYRYSAFVHRMLQVKMAFEAGALGVILVGYHDEFIPKGLGYPMGLKECIIPAIGITQKVFQTLALTEIKSVAIDYCKVVTPLKANNIIVDIGGREPGLKRLALGAHYDSWYQGWLDNAISVQMLADLIEEIGAHGLRHPVRAIFFDAEEIGLLGSKYHLDQPQNEACCFYLNLEMPIESCQSRLKMWVYAGDRAVLSCLKRLSFLWRGVWPLPLGLFYRLLGGFPADIHYFYLKNIPCVTTFCSHPYYHTPLDNRENLRLDKYHKVLRQISSVIANLDRKLDTVVHANNRAQER